MIWLVITIAIIFLFLFYLFLTWKNKRDLTKLRRIYDENRNREESERQPGNWDRTKKITPGNFRTEQLIERDVEPETERVLPTSNGVSFDPNSGEFRINVKDLVNIQEKQPVQEVPEVQEVKEVKEEGKKTKPKPKIKDIDEIEIDIKDIDNMEL